MIGFGPTILGFGAIVVIVLCLAQIPNPGPPCRCRVPGRIRDGRCSTCGGEAP